MALEEKQMREIKKLVPSLAEEGIIVKKEEHKKLVNFYLDLAEDSLNSAQAMYKLSVDSKLQNLAGFPNLKGFLWVINPSYYSMFYLVSALLASKGIKIKSKIGVHKLTFHAFVYYFYLTDKITKNYVEDFLEMQEEAEELLGKDEIVKKAEKKAKELIFHLDWERRKRKTFTYELERTKIMTKAKTSLERANSFYKEIKKLIGKKG